MNERLLFPFTAISGQEDFKLCLLLCMVDPSIGGVLAKGDKGTGKTTTVRGLSALMKKAVGDFPFINLPLGATEDRVLGSIQLSVLINEKKTEIKKGLLAEANKGILYIDEVNLLNDYLMDVLLDASATGGYYLERENISQYMESLFCLVGTMNPEEGDLRPQLLDRFGLSVSIDTPQDIAARVEIMGRRMAFDTHPVNFIKKYEEDESSLGNKILEARNNLENILFPDVVYSEVAALCLKHKVEGLRADILLLKAGRAFAALYQKKEVSMHDILKVAPYVLSHRSKNFQQQHQSPNKGGQEPQGEEKEGDTERLMIK